MKIQLAHIVQHLFGVSSLEEVNVESLENLVKEYPYFSTAHFLLATKKQHMNGIASEDVMQKAAMYFHDPLWLKWQMGEGEIEKERVSEVLNGYQMNDESRNAVKAEMEQDGRIIAEDEQPLEAEVGTTTEPEADFRVQESHHIEEAEEYNAETSHLAEVTENGRVGEDERPEINEHQNYFAESLSSPAETHEAITAGESEDFHDRQNEDQNQETEEQNDDTKEQYESEEELRGPGEYRAQYLGPEEKPTQPDDRIPIADDQTQVREGSVSAVSEPAASENRPEPVAEAPLVFQAYHTIDYFASQGIKAPAEVQPNDKLGRQLRSFTEWLKTMKRLPQAEAEVAPDENEQQHIRQSADGSLKKEEVVTETMAEVLAKQERKHEAIAIYEKLSLLDPSKSAYFAAKIENLKEH